MKEPILFRVTLQGLEIEEDDVEKTLAAFSARYRRGEMLFESQEELAYAENV